MNSSVPNRPANEILLLVIISTLVFNSACILPRSRSQPNVQNAQRQSGYKNVVLATAADLKTKQAEVEREFNKLLLAKDFDTIESKAKIARERKERLVGGYWKIDLVYDGLVSFIAEFRDQKVTDDMWRNRIELIRSWTIARPESITARIALARANIEYAWFARGGGTIETVAEGDYKLFQERLAEAESILADLGEKGLECPRFYREMLYLGTLRGWPDDKTSALYETAIKSEPNYLQYYLVRSNHLTPKWGGQPGEWRRFLEQLPEKLSLLETDEADIIYFVVLANRMRERRWLSINWEMVSKERIRKGFVDLEKRYGVDNFRLNQYALVACRLMDLGPAREAFGRIGKDRDDNVWTMKTFAIMKTLAFEGRAPFGIDLDNEFLD